MKIMMINHLQLDQKTSRLNGATRRVGFTLIELLVVIAIIALIAALLISALNQATKTARRTASQRSAAALAQSVDQFFNEFGFLPPLVHDGRGVSADDDLYRPRLPDGTVADDGPIFEQAGAQGTFYSVVIWSDEIDFNFFRRRTGTGADNIELSSGGHWEDRRYSKFTLAYYLTGVLDRDVDGVRGPGFARPIIDGSYLGVGYPIGSSRDRFEPMIDVDRRGVQVAIDYAEPNEYLEHDTNLDLGSIPTRDDIYMDYEDYQRDALVSLVDAFGNAYRYYRWEQGRFVNGQLVVNNTLDLNIPPVLIDPVLLAEIVEDINNADVVDLTGGDVKLRDARYAIVSAGPDGLFGTESIDTIADRIGATAPSNLNEIAQMRKDVWEDNAVEIGN
jgi:prepilin-type N-terminal cleavage/methylation domain-containing protein